MVWFKKERKHAAVLGCGPAGLFAAHALVEADWQVDIFSKRRRSDMFGAQYLHAPIPGLPQYRTRIHYILKGTAEEYAAKVYGQNDMPADQVSPALLSGTQDAWDIRAAYYAAFEKYSRFIIDTNITQRWLQQPSWGGIDRGRYNLVISSIPAPLLCLNPKAHSFLSQRVWALGDAPERGQKVPFSCEDNTVICNGELAPSWYRLSNIFGYRTVEWPERRKPPLVDVAEVEKPIGNTCDCWKGEIRRVGRYGAWRKGVLSHHAYEWVRALS